MLGVFADWLLQPLSLFVLGMVFVALMSLFLQWGAILRRSALLGTMLVFLLFASPLFANFLVKQLEGARQNPDWCESEKADLPVVVPGGGKNDWVDSSSVYDILEPASIRRVAGAAEIAGENTRFFLLGGGSGRFREAELMAQVLLDFGVPAERIVMERQSRSTLENARELSKLLEREGFDNKRICLVTSSLHILRASKVLESQGFEVCHYATDTRYAPSVMPVSLMPYVGALEKTTEALHEYLGYFYYWLKAEV